LSVFPRSSEKKKKKEKKERKKRKKKRKRKEKGGDCSGILYHVDQELSARNGEAGWEGGGSGEKKW